MGSLGAGGTVFAKAGDTGFAEAVGTGPPKAGSM